MKRETRITRPVTSPIHATKRTPSERDFHCRNPNCKALQGVGRPDGRLELRYKDKLDIGMPGHVSVCRHCGTENVWFPPTGPTASPSPAAFMSPAA